MVEKKRNKKLHTAEMLVLMVLSIIIFILSSLQVKDIISIWNQNDEFGTWQGGAWVLGLDWSEVASTNAYYGHGYGYVLAFFIKFYGHNTVLMTHMAIYFQVFMHTSCIFIAWYCIRKMFPSVNAVVRVIASSVSILSIPDLFYNYMFFSECILRFLVWLTFGVVVSYSYQKKWYKLLLINMIAVYAFSIHQRCILLLAMSVLLFFYEGVCHLIKNESKLSSLLWIGLIILFVVIFYKVEYKNAQDSYISALYSASGHESVGGNLLSERGYTIEWILKDVIFNLENERIAMQNLLGHIYYVCAFDCGFSFFGFILCFSNIKEKIAYRRKDNFIPYIYMCGMALVGIFLVVYQMANEWVYSRVELMHYGRYCSYLFAPMIMFGIIWLLTENVRNIRKSVLIVISFLLLAGLSTFNVLKSHNVVNLFAFSNACPGIKSVYFTENPFTATLYHTVLGVIWILLPAVIVLYSKKYIDEKQQFITVLVFIVIASFWINIANREWNEQYEAQRVYVTQTYDLQNILEGLDEFVAYKSFSYGSGLLQYNNPFSKVYIRQSLDEFNSTDDNRLVVSQKGIEEMNDILQTYELEYENERYFIWRYETNQ